MIPIATYSIGRGADEDGLEACQGVPQCAPVEERLCQFRLESRRSRAPASALAAIVAHPDMGIWVNLANVGLAQTFASQA
jgi:hypothetical protein